MTVRAILKNKSPEVYTADEHEVFLTLVERLTRHDIGVLVVLDLAGRLLGIISERDLVRGLARYTSSVFAHTARDMMTTKVYVCSPDEPESDIMLRMVENHIRHMPVMEHNKVIGLVSLGDLVEYRLRKLGHRPGQHAGVAVAEVGGGSFSRHLGLRPGPKIG